MKIYISGPITGVPEYESLVAFNNVEDRIARAGHTPVNPRRISGWGLTWETYMKIAKEVMHDPKIKAICMMKGWEKSKGCMMEIMWARALGLPIIYEPGAVRA